jgi:transcription elongation GreA/GreB family factor
MGRALLLRQVGEAVEVQAPGGIFQYQIESIRYTGE